MSLKLRLKPHEKLIIGGAVMVNGPKAAEFLIENNVPILRETDIMGESQVTSPARRLYFCVQLMYIDLANLERYHSQFNELSAEIAIAAPSTNPFLIDIYGKVMSSEYYFALKLVRKLIDYEDSLIEMTLNSPH